MAEKLIGYNLKWSHVKGEANNIPDYLSRTINGEAMAPEFHANPPAMMLRSRVICKKGVDESDPQLFHISEIGTTDEHYKQLISNIKEKSFNKEDSYFPIRDSLSVCTLKDGSEIAVKDGKEVIIPVNYQNDMLEVLHSTHMSSEGVKRIARGKLWWAGISKDI